MQIELARKAAKWWADFLRNGAPLDNGATDKSNLMAKSLASLLQTKERGLRNAEQIQSFEDMLAAYFASLAEGDHWQMAAVDYNPCHVLLKAAIEAKIDLGMASLPWKTSMKFINGRVMVKCGYGTGFKELD